MLQRWPKRKVRTKPELGHCGWWEKWMGCACNQGQQTHLVEDVLQFELRECGALHILHRTQILGHAFAIFSLDRSHSLFSKLLAHCGIVTQVHLRADDQTRNAGTMVMDLGEPLLADVLEGCWRRNAETDEEDVGLGVR